MLREALRYPTRGDEAVETFLIGGALHLVTALVLPILLALVLVPLVFVAGYLVRVLDHATSVDRLELRNDADIAPPTFRDPVRLLRDGLAAMAVSVAYLVVPIVVLLVTVGGAISHGTSANGLGFGGAFTFLTGSIVTLLIAVTFVYFLPAGLIAYANTRRVRAAFEWRRLKAFAGRGTYFYAFWVSVVIAVFVGTIVGPLNAVALGFFLLFYAEVAVAVLCGQACSDSRVGGAATSE